MFDSEPSKLFEVRRVSDQDWVVYDCRVPADDARCVIACVHSDEDDNVEVRWVDGRVMPTRYLSVGAVIDDLVVAERRRGGSTRPIAIPHYPPVSA